jgi:hypothetical protein
VFDKNEYWTYLCGGKSWDFSRDGLLYFIIDCFWEIMRRNWLSVEEEGRDILSDCLARVKYHLEQMKNAILLKEKADLSGTGFDFSKHLMLINECVKIFPSEQLSKAGKTFKIQANEIVQEIV